MSPKIVALPFPPTLLSFFGCFLHSKIGEPLVTYHYRPDSPHAMESGYAIKLFGPALGAELRALIRERWSGLEAQRLERLLNFCRGGDNRDLLRTLCSVEWYNPRAIVIKATHFFEMCLAKNIDLFKYEATIESREEEIPSPPPKGRRWLTVPTVAITDTKEARDVVGYNHVELDESQAWILQNHHLAFVIGGPPRSGKSTLAAALADELKNIIRSLKSRTGYEEFDLGVACGNLDAATPTVEAIADMRGQDRAALRKAKQPWTEDLAIETLVAFMEEKRRANITVGDLPGGNPDRITEVLCAAADGAMILTRDWTLQNAWARGFASYGVPVLSKARTRLTEEGVDSLVTQYVPGNRISGRITGLDRTVRSWDPFVGTLAQVLLFDLFPSLVKTREERMQRTLA